VDARIRRGGSNPYGLIWILTLKRMDAEGLQQRKEVNDQKALPREGLTMKCSTEVFVSLSKKIMNYGSY